MNRILRQIAMMVAMGLLATACLPKGVRLPQSPLLPALERKSGLIAYLGIDGNIYTVDQSGSRPTQVTKDADVAGEFIKFYDVPAWAPDGQSLAFAQYSGKSDGSEPPSVGLFTARKDGANLTQAYASQDDVIFYYWSPDSRQISFLAGLSNSNMALKLIAPAGGEAQTLDIGAPFYWSWAPDSHAVLVHIGDTDGHLSLLQLGDTVTEQSLGIKPTTFRAPAYSPDGSRMLVAGEDLDGRPALLLMDASGANPQTIIEYTGNIAFAWSADGQRIAYAISDDSSLGGLGGHLTVVDPSGKKASVEIKDTIIYAFFWSPDGKSIAYFSTHEIPAPTPQPGNTSPPEQPQTAWDLSVLDVKSGDTHPVLSPLAPSKKFSQLIPYFDQYHQSATIWSPDSRNLVITTYYSQSDSPGIFVVDASGNLQPRHIADGLVGLWSWK